MQKLLSARGRCPLFRESVIRGSTVLARGEDMAKSTQGRSQLFTAMVMIDDAMGMWGHAPPGKFLVMRCSGIASEAMFWQKLH